MNFQAALKNEKIYNWFLSAHQLQGVSNLHWKQQVYLDNCRDEMQSYLEQSDFQGMTKVAAAYYQRTKSDAVKDFIANVWDRYTTVLNFMGIDTSAVEFIDLDEVKFS